MKHFIVMVHYTASTEIIDKFRPAHRAFLQTGYDAGMLLLSGPCVPRTDGIVVARAESMDEIMDFFKKDPYQQNNLTTYAYFEFDPVMHHPSMKTWVNPKESIRTTE